MNYTQAKERAQGARDRARELGLELKKFPRNAIGLVPDHVKFSPAYQDLKRRYDAAFAQERQANAFLVKHFKTELQQERRAKERMRLEAGTHQLVTKMRVSMSENIPALPHTVNQALFVASASCTKLHNHGRQWEVRWGQYSAFSDAPDAGAALRDVHRSAVSNALFLNDPEFSGMNRPGECPELPTSDVLADYPDLCEKFAHVLQNTLDFDDQEPSPLARPRM